MGTGRLQGGGRLRILAALLLTAAWLSTGAIASGAEEPELVTDRPDFTESSLVVPRGRLQIEGGFSYTRGNSGERAWNLPEMLLRLGVASRWELRLEAPQYL